MNSQFSFAQETNSLAEKYNIDFPVALTLDADKHKFEVYSNAREKLQALALFLTKPTVEKLKESLSADITAKKQALRSMLGEKIYNELDIERMGQINSERIAQDCINQLDSPLTQNSRLTPYFQQFLVKAEIYAKIQNVSSFTVEGDAFSLSISPSSENSDKYAIEMPIDNQSAPILVALAKVDIANSGVSYLSELQFNDAVIKKLGEVFYDNKTFNELGDAVYAALITENQTGFDLHKRLSMLNIEQNNIPNKTNPSDLSAVDQFEP